jgi:two-component system, cell cycle sensor histidine kinase and response regulator CckA
METAELRNTVVLITGEEHVRKAVSSTLEKAGFIVLAASNANAALSLCQEPDTPVQLVIVDAGTGPVNEPGFLESLYRCAPGIRVLFLSDSASQEAVEHLEKPWQGRLVLRKPFRRAHLLGKVLEVMSEPLAFTA